jgi:hypothetical protein
MRVPVELRLKKAEKLLEVAFDDGTRFRLPAEYLRVESPSAEVQGHGPGQKTLVPGRAHVAIIGLEPVGNCAVRSPSTICTILDLFLGLSPSARRRAREALARLSRRPGGERTEPGARAVTRH